MRRLDPNDMDEDRLAKECAESGAAALFLGIMFLVSMGGLIALVIGSFL